MMDSTDATPPGTDARELHAGELRLVMLKLHQSASTQSGAAQQGDGDADRVALTVELLPLAGGPTVKRRLTRRLKELWSRKQFERDLFVTEGLLHLGRRLSAGDWRCQLSQAIAAGHAPQPGRKGAKR